MSSPPNYLKVYRKRSGLNQQDIAFLMDIQDYSNISHYEKGRRSPTMQLLLTYKHLFDTPIESFYEQESELIRIKLIAKIKVLITESKREQITLKNTLRIKFLEEAIKRLTK